MSECRVGKAIAAVAGLARGAKPSRREARREAIMQAATQLFVEKGYGATSLNDVVRLSGGSLSTLYDMFGNKAGLFQAIVTHRCEMMTGLFDHPDVHSRPVGEALTEHGTRLLSVLVADDTVAAMRTVIAEALQFPELAQVFYEAGPIQGRQRVAGYLAEQMRRGVLRTDDPVEAAADFCHLVIRDAQMNAIMGLPYPDTAAAITRQVGHAVEQFLRMYRADGAVQPAANLPGTAA